MRRRVVLALTAVALSGCPLFISPYVTVKPEVDVKKKTLLVVPFSDSKNTYFESEDGALLSSMVRAEVRRCATKARLVDPKELVTKFPGHDFEEADWQAVGLAVGADYVVVGHIDTFTVRDPGNPNLYLGTIAVGLSVVDTIDGSQVYHVEPGMMRCRWSSSGRSDVGMPIFDITEQEVRLQTLALATKRIGDVFCPRKISRAEYQRRQRSSVRMLSP